jgi:hypothetical protein
MVEGTIGGDDFQYDAMGASFPPNGFVWQAGIFSFG